MEKHGVFDGEYLRYMAEEVLYRFGIIMGEAWTTTQANFYNLPNLHEPGNAANLLTIMINKIVPGFAPQQEYLRVISTKIVRTASGKSNPVQQTLMNPTPKKGTVHLSLSKPHTQPKASMKLSKGSLCLTHLKFKLGITQVGCLKLQNSGIPCRNDHRTPTKKNKKELQQIMGQAGHHGTAAERGQIHLELAKL